MTSNKEETAKFAQMWNQIIKSFRLEDLINNRCCEVDLIHTCIHLFKFFLLVCTDFYMHFVMVIREMNLLLMPDCADLDLDLIQWPPFLLASKVYYILNDFLS